MSDSTSASSSNSPRASMIAVPCSPIEPDSSTLSPGRRPCGLRRARGSGRADAGGREVHLVGVAALDDLGVAGDDLDAGRARRRARSRRPRRAGRRSPGPPRGSSRAVSASGRAPATARSLTVPLTASSPIEPPGKRSGLTTKESVVTTTSPARRRRRRARCMPKAGANSPSISVCVALPPAPWAIVIAASLKRGRLARAVSMIPRIRSSRPVALTRPPAPARSGRSCNRRRRRPRG